MRGATPATTFNEWLGDSAWDRLYWTDVRERALALNSDGCTGVPGWLIWTCWEHDIHYRTHTMLDGTTLDRQTADYIYRVRLQQMSPLAGVGWRWGFSLGWMSPSSWWRWAFVRLFGGKAWG